MHRGYAMKRFYLLDLLCFGYCGFVLAATDAPIAVVGIGFVAGLLVRSRFPTRVSVSVPEVVPMILHCPECSERHVDAGEFASKPHHTHACQECGHVWRPAKLPTVGVQFLPGFRDADLD